MQESTPAQRYEATGQGKDSGQAGYDGERQRQGSMLQLLHGQGKGHGPWAQELRCKAGSQQTTATQAARGTTVAEPGTTAWTLGKAVAREPRGKARAHTHEQPRSRGWVDHRMPSNHAHSLAVGHKDLVPTKRVHTEAFGRATTLPLSTPAQTKGKQAQATQTAPRGAP